jgi:type I restriction-modification system DNA methylase subunit
MNLTDFETQFQQYLSRIEEARLSKAHHDQLRSIFIGFLSRAFGVDYEEFELEKGVRATKVRGFMDALFQDIVFEFKRDLDTERETGRRELTDYLSSLKGGTYFGVLTDGLLFEVYILRENKLEKIDSILLKTLSAEDAFSWFDRFLFSTKELVPTSQDIVKRFGPRSPVFLSSFQKLRHMFSQSKDSPSVSVKFEEWDKLLSKVYGSSVASDELFLRHTYLSILVKLIAYLALFMERPKHKDEFFSILEGEAFRQRGFQNLAESDFFTWLLSAPLLSDAHGLLRGLAQHLSAYDLSKINEDLLKELYQQLVDPETRHVLGEFYTPDWLAELTLRQALWGKGKSLLDPACGSGTFLFIAIRLLREQGLCGAALVEKAMEDIVGVDVHPLAVTIAKINYLLALAPELTGYEGKITIPIYMADSLVMREKLSFGEESFPVTVTGGEKFGIPTDMIVNPDTLDRVIDEMRFYAGKSTEEAIAGFEAYLRRQGYDKWLWLWLQNLRLMTKLVQEGRDTIWAFILKNYYRPVFFCRRSFTLVAGNPPWLAYRYIRDPDYQSQIKKLTMRYKLLSPKDVKLFTHMDTSTLFFAYSLYMYVRSGETIAFVMPRSVITGAKQHANFRSLIAGKAVAFWEPKLRKLIDLEKVVIPETPTQGVFNVPACVLIARKSQKEGRPIQRLDIKGILPKKNLSWQEAQTYLTIQRSRVSPEALLPPIAGESYYFERFKEGATIVPRCFWFVRPAVGEGLGIIDHAKPYLRTHPDVERDAKEPWKGIEISGEVEASFLYATLLGKHLLPFGYTKLDLVILPVEISEISVPMLNSQTALHDGYSGLHNWLSQVENLWQARKKKSVKENVYQWLDYRRKLLSQRSSGYYNVLLGTSGTHIASCVVDATSGGLEAESRSTHGFLADTKTFFYQTKELGEAHYLCALLNSRYVDEAIKQYQTKGAWGERDIYRRPFEALPIPQFDAKDRRHLRLAELSQECHQKVAQLALEGKSIGSLRNKVRDYLSSELDEIDRLVKNILS